MRGQRILALTLAAAVVAAWAYAQAQPAGGGGAAGELKTLKQQVSYIVGSDMGKQFKQRGFEPDIEALSRGLRDALADQPSPFTADQVENIMGQFQRELLAGVADRNLAKGKAFLDANAQKQGIVTRKSGLQYKVLREGKGATPTLNDTFTAHYRGTLINGAEFDSSYRRQQPITAPVNQMIPGWIEALQIMKVGDKWELYVPADLAYGPEGRPPHIGPNEVLIFEVELLGVAE